MYMCSLSRLINCSPFFFSSQYNVEQRQREMEEEKREKLQQLIRKKKDEQSEYHMSCSSPYCNVFS